MQKSKQFLKANNVKEKKIHFCSEIFIHERALRILHRIFWICFKSILYM